MCRRLQREAEITAEITLERALPLFGESHGATPVYAHDPVTREEGACDGRAERSGEMVAALAPIQAGPGEGAPAVKRLRLDAPLGQELIAAWGDLKRLLMPYQHAAIEQRLGQRDAKRPREVIVAGASEAHRFDLFRLASVRERGGRAMTAAHQRG